MNEGGKNFIFQFYKYTLLLLETYYGERTTQIQNLVSLWKDPTNWINCLGITTFFKKYIR